MTIKESWGDLASRIIGVSIFLVVLGFGLKGCIITVWKPPSELVSYAIAGADKREMHIVFLPTKETMIWYRDPGNQLTEGALIKMRGVYGTHYFGPVWHIDAPNVFLGYRVYSEGEPVSMEIEVLQKYMKGRGSSSFPKVGDKSYSIILFAQDKVRFSDMWLYKQEMNPEVADRLLALLEPKKAQP